MDVYKIYIYNRCVSPLNIASTCELGLRWRKCAGAPLKAGVASHSAVVVGQKVVLEVGSHQVLLMIITMQVFQYHCSEYTWDRLLPAQ